MPLENKVAWTADYFGDLYREYYAMLCMIAYEYTKDKALAEEMVGDTFLHLWEKRDTIEIKTSIKNYLIRSIQNTCLQDIRKRKIEVQPLENESIDTYIPWGEDYPLGDLFGKELEGMIEKAIQSLPEQCRNVFLLSRYEELSYSEIAAQLNISENTVKTHIKTALLRLRVFLKDYLLSFLYLL